MHHLSQYYVPCITMIEGTTIDKAEDLDSAKPVYILTEYGSNYSRAAGSLWLYSKDETSNVHAAIANTDFKFFMWKAKLLGNTAAQPNQNHTNEILKNITIAESLKYLTNFWRSFQMLLVIWKVELKLKWRK